MRFLAVIIIMFSFQVYCQKVELIVNSGHKDVIESIDLSMNGDRLITSCRDGSVKIWDMPAKREITTFYVPEKKLSKGYFYKDKYIIYVLDKDKIVYRDYDSFEVLFEHEVKYCNTIIPSPDGEYFAVSGDDYKVKVYRTGTKDVIIERPLKMISNVVCFSDDSADIIFVNGDSEIEQINIGTGTTVYRSEKNPREVEYIAYSHGKLALLTTAYYNYYLEIYDTKNNKKLTEFYSSKDVVFSDCGNYIFSVKREIIDDQYVFELDQYNSDTGELVRILGENISGRCFETMKGRLLVGSDKSVYCFNVETGRDEFTLEGRHTSVQSAAVSPDGSKLVIGTGKIGFFGERQQNAKVWDFKEGERLSLLEGHLNTITSAVFSNDGKILATGDYNGKISLWDTDSKDELTSFFQKGRIRQLAFRPDGKILASVSNEAMEESNNICLWDIENDDLKKQLEITKNVASVAFSPNGRLMLTGLGSFIGSLYDSIVGVVDEITIWDAKTGNKIRSVEGWEKFNLDILIKSDSQTAFAGGNSKINVIDLKTMKKKQTFSFEDVKQITCMLMAPDEKSVYAGTIQENSRIFQIDIQTGAILKEFKGHKDGVSSLAFTPDKKRLISGSRDGTVKFWNAETGEKVADLMIIDPADWVIVTSDGKFSGSEGGIASMHYVYEGKVIPLDAFFEYYYTPRLLTGVFEGTYAPAKNKQYDLTKTLRLPPAVRFTDPEANMVSDNENMKLTVEVTDMGGGIDEVLLFQNGKILSDNTRGVTVKGKKGGKITRTFDVILIPGRNIFRATAFNDDRTECVNPPEIEIEMSSGTASCDLYVLSIGINEYQNPKYKLNYGRPDAEAFCTALQEGGGQIFKEIKVFSIYDSDAVKANIDKKISELKNSVRPNDVFIMFYAGHGVTGKTKDGETDFFLVPSDITQLYGNDDILNSKAVSAKYLKQICTEIKAQKQVILIDACQSGGAVETFATRGAAEEKAVLQLARSTGVMVMASTGTDQFASEFEDLGHGVFTYAFINGLNGEADSGEMDGKITVAELKAYIEEQVPELTEKYRGVPQYPNSYFKGMDFPVSVAR